MIKRLLRIILLPIGFIVVAFFAWVGIQYAVCPVYEFPEPRPFSGDRWYNPYADLTPGWIKANFHAHCRSWGGLTDGKDSIEDLYDQYKNMGFDLISVSNYQSILAHDSLPVNTIPVYEHGYSTRKVHQLAIGAKNVVWGDYAFRQTVHNRQHIINRVRRNADFVALAHPKMMNGYRYFDLKHLTNYAFFEVLNHYRTSTARWDTALSAGRLSWIVGNDDTHNVYRMRETGVRWTMINAESTSKKEVYAAMRAGRMFGVRGKGGFNDNGLKRVEIVDGRLIVECSSPAREIIFIGQGGAPRDTTFNSARAQIDLLPGDAYIRTEIQSDSTRIYLNPVIRYDGVALPRHSARVDPFGTWLQRFVFILILGGAGLVVILRRKKRTTA